MKQAVRFIYDQICDSFNHQSDVVVNTAIQPFLYTQHVARISQKSNVYGHGVGHVLASSLAVLLPFFVGRYF